MKIAGLVVLYNPKENIISTINNYIDEVDILYLIDNSNNDNSKMFKNKKIKYIANKENLGIAKALNMGAQMAINDGYKWLLTMDQDSIFENKSLSQLIEYTSTLDYEKVGIVSPWHHTKEEVVRPVEEVEELLDVMTSGNLLNLELYQKIGGFKEWLFIDSVDIEYCLNLNRNGYKVLRYNKSELIHELGDIKIIHILNRGLVCSNHNYIRRYYICRNVHYVSSMYNDIFPEYCNYIKNGLKGAFRNILFFEKDKYRKLRNMIRGYKDFKKGVKGKYPYSN